MARQGKYPSQISALIEQAAYQRMRQLEETQEVSFAHIIRDVIKAGLPAVERKYAKRAQRASQ